MQPASIGIAEFVHPVKYLNPVTRFQAVQPRPVTRHYLEKRLPVTSLMHCPDPFYVKAEHFSYLSPFEHRTALVNTQEQDGLVGRSADFGSGA